jgi:hypothetical protein
MFKIKLIQKEIGPVYIGLSAFSIPAGTIVKVVSEKRTESGDILIRTFNDVNPFQQIISNKEKFIYEMSLLRKLGYDKIISDVLWGDAIDSHKFEVLPSAKISDYINLPYNSIKSDFSLQYLNLTTDVQD